MRSWKEHTYCLVDAGTAHKKVASIRDAMYHEQMLFGGVYRLLNSTGRTGSSSVYTKSKPSCLSFPVRLKSYYLRLCSQLQTKSTYRLPLCTMSICLIHLLVGTEQWRGFHTAMWAHGYSNMDS